MISRRFDLPVMALCALSVLLGGCLTAQAQLTPYSQDFESLARQDPNALAGDGWRLFAAGINGNESFPDFTFGPIGAPNDIGNPQSSVISDFASGGDPPAGEQGLVVFSDYDSGLHSDPSDPRDLVISIFQEQTIATSDIGKVAVFDFLAEGNANPPSGDAIVEAFMLTLDPNNGFVVTNNLFIDTSNVPDGDPTPLQISLSLANPALDGQILQFGFRNTSQNGDGTAVDYDNVSLSVVPEPTGLALAAVGSVVALAFARRRHR